jgi:hypothetical protein
MLDAAIAAVWWHAQTGRAIAAHTTGDLGCHASCLAQQLPPVLAQQLAPMMGWTLILGTGSNCLSVELPGQL